MVVCVTSGKDFEKLLILLTSVTPFPDCALVSKNSNSVFSVTWKNETKKINTLAIHIYKIRYNIKWFGNLQIQCKISNILNKFDLTDFPLELSMTLSSSASTLLPTRTLQTSGEAFCKESIHERWGGPLVYVR